MSRKLALAVSVLAVLAGSVVAAAFAATQTKAAGTPTPISDSSLHASFTTVGGGATVLRTQRTVPHWWGSTLNPDDGVTYGYNMVGADPGSCSGSACDVTVDVDITPINVTVDGFPGYTFDGTDVVDATLASPQFALNDYGSTPAATDPGFAEGPGGVLSQGDASLSLQLQDATMRAQFNQTGSSPYHLRLHPNVLPAVTINVPKNHATLLQSGRGVVFADVNISWWSARIKNLETKADPTHLPVYLTNDVLLYEGKDVTNCCVIGYHGTGAEGGGSANGNGKQPVQTFAWASYVSPGIYARPSGGVYWALQDIHALSHEIAEWADDPFVNNWVEPWLTPTAPQYGCTPILETGDPVVAIGFAQGTNTFEQGPNPDGTQSADGYYHPEDEVFLPWFMRTAPNTVSEATQSPSPNGGRYSLMGDLNPFPGFRQPATGC
jgi:hypothetical protein